MIDMIETKAAGRAIRILHGAVAVLAIAAVAAIIVTCDRTDPIAPEGSTVTVTATPQTLVIPPGTADATCDPDVDPAKPGCTVITATLRGKNGVRTPDQEIVFTTTRGRFFPAWGTAQTTDDQGEASIGLETKEAATVTAQSGSISGNTTIQVATGVVSSLLLNADPQVISTCQEKVSLLLSAIDASGEGVGGVTISVTLRFPSGYPGYQKLEGNLDLNQLKTDLNGDANTMFTPVENFCETNCGPTDPNGGNCVIEVVAEAVSQGVSSEPVVITETVP